MIVQGIIISESMFTMFIVIVKSGENIKFMRIAKVTGTSRIWVAFSLFTKKRKL